MCSSAVASGASTFFFHIKAYIVLWDHLRSKVNTPIPDTLASGGSQFDPVHIRLDFLRYEFNGNSTVPLIEIFASDLN